MVPARKDWPVSMGCYKLSIIEGLDVQAIPGDWQEDSQHSGEILESKNTSKRF